MPSPKTFAAVICTALFCGQICIAAQWPLPLFTSDPKSVLVEAASRKTLAGADAVVLLVDVNLRFDAAGRATWTQQAVIHLLTPSSVRMYSTFSVPWTAWQQNRTRVRARTISPDGIAHLLDPATITDSGVSAALAVGILSDSKILSAPLPAISPGAVIEEEAIFEDRESLFPGGQFLRLPVATGVQVQWIHVAVEAPQDTTLKVTPDGFTFDRHEELRPGHRKAIAIEASDVSAPPKLNLLPPERNQGLTVGVSAGATWNAVASWYSDIVDRLAGPMPPSPAKLSPADLRAKVDGILSQVQRQVRYTGLELGLSSFIPHSPAATLERGYGDCKDKAVLLVSRLRKEGVAASLALLTPYPAPDVHPDLPGIEPFRHAIVFVPGNPPLWLDPSFEFATASRLPLPDEGRFALVAGPGSERLVRTPESGVEQNRIVETRTVTLAPSGSGKVTITRQFYGGIADSVRIVLANSDTRDLLRQQAAAELKTDVVAIDWDRSASLLEPCWVSIIADPYASAVTNGEAAYAEISGASLDLDPLYPMEADVARIGMGGGATSRGADYFLLAAFQSEQSIHIVPPPGFAVKALPKFTDTWPGRLTLVRRIRTAADGAVDISQFLASPKRRYTAEEAQAITGGIRRLAAEGIRIEFVRQ